MSGDPFERAEISDQHRVVGPDGQEVEPVESEDEGGHRPVTDLVEQPAKVMRIGSMIRQLLEEVKSAPLDVASRVRLRDIHQTSIKELEDGLAPELVEELERLSLPFDKETPSEDELRIAQAQLVGWLEGLFHGIQTAIYAQQIAAQSQLQQMRRALPGAPGASPQGLRPGMPGYQQPEEGQQPRPGMYL
ncbi:bacterial proteasome activator family protein [Mumia sp. zg.B53]|uniref:bacterial proteasome activator family protein n=1 Tax=unclassified Mumia TaxID=2621872 RepID=UPI001C6DFE1D|nr:MULTISPECIES: bacterial proteasome activator family protein [unclassified Mumia]MBW9207585.1 bacterial proteasome activator family protein [Mumia sp. zg.B17]MBW9210069.1 bacterial proteasome activator family protein [Mumia sp. zg.B21]MBW9214673.1 bacterial proteasome activator family protein [Mumia sp. zg.B53]MDD9348935.1 bacterial proteasome activator family protein [Mumia sp.]